MIIADYIGYCNKEGKPIGHTIKTISEAIEILDKKEEITLAIPKISCSFFENYNIKFTHNVTTSSETTKSNIKKISHVVKKIIIINKILKENNKIWFINTDFWIFFRLAFYKKKNKKIYITNYIDYCNKDNKKNNFRSWFYKKSLCNIENIFTTNKNIYSKKEINIPDYIYEKIKYQDYISDKKNNEVVFAGTINQAKDIKGLVEAFNINKQKLTIAGKFNSDELYKEIYEMANDNIKLFNDYLSYDEYYKLLGKYKYVVLPYKECEYKNRSSGVILEAIFCDSIPIIPKFMADDLNVYGIEYDNIEDLKRFDIKNYSDEEINNILKMNLLKKNSCDINSLKKIYREIFERV